MNGDLDMARLYAALDRQRASRHLSWAGVAKEIADRYARVSPATIGRVHKKGRVEGDGIIQMLLWLDRSPESFVPGGVNRQEECLTSAGTSRTLRWDTNAIYCALEKKRNREDLTWPEVAGQIDGVSVSTLTRFKLGGRTYFPELMRVIQWLGDRANQYTRQSSG